jgi:hypothetical protein
MVFMGKEYNGNEIKPIGGRHLEKWRPLWNFLKIDVTPLLIKIEI